MGILLWVVVGIVTGSVAKLVMPGPPAGGRAVAVAICVGGAVLGGLLGAVFTGGPVIDFDPFSLLSAVSGALIVSLFYRSYALRTVS